MPEGHTIHRLARELRRDLGGTPVAVSSPQGRFAAGAALLDGATLRRAEAYGKHLFLDFDPRPEPAGRLHVHLGLFGTFRRTDPERAHPGAAVRLRLQGTTATWDLAGPTACELVDEAAAAALLARLGPDPLRRDADVERFVARVGASRRAVGALLLDQAVIAGVGNVYRSELCFRLGVDPRTPGRDLDPDQLRALWDDAVQLLTLGVRLGRIVTVDVARGPVGRGGSRRSPARRRADERVYVYRREHCLQCGAPVSWFDLANRRAYACPVDQPA